MVEDFSWARSHKNRGKAAEGRVRENSNRFYYPGLTEKVGKSFSRHRSSAVYNYDKEVLSFEVLRYSPFEWHDTRRMRNITGRKLGELLGADKWLYYTDQPMKSRTGNGKNVYFQQFCCKHGIPTDEELMKAWDILCEAPVEGQECGEYKYRRFDQGATPIGRTSSRLNHRRKKEEEEYERQLEEEG